MPLVSFVLLMILVIYLFIVFFPVNENGKRFENESFDIYHKYAMDRIAKGTKAFTVHMILREDLDRLKSMEKDVARDHYVKKVSELWSAYHNKVTELKSKNILHGNM